MSESQGGGFSRREVLRVLGAAAGMATIGSAAAHGQGINMPATGNGAGPIAILVRDDDDAPANAPEVNWAIGFLRDALAANGITPRLIRPHPHP